ncbi:MAG: di-heme oxidoredictase family protein [Rhizobiaceae bacterium]
MQARIFISAALLLTASNGLAAEKPWSENAISTHVQMPMGTLSKPALEELTRQGKVLFSAKFTPHDGSGRPMATQAIIPTKRKRPSSQSFNRVVGMDSNGCSSCHNEPIVGGAGNFVSNVFVSEGFNNQGSDSIDPQFSNERNTNHIMGAGLIELLAREMTADLVALRKEALTTARKDSKPATVVLVTKGVNFGQLTASPDGLVDLSKLDGLDTDLVIRPFSQKGVMTSLRQFTVNALNHHHGIQATERFGIRWTGEDDFDGDGVTNEMSPGDISALVAWQATLAPPTKMTPKTEIWKIAAAKGSTLFDDILCSSCHIKALPLNSLKFSDPGPVDAAGTIRGSDVSASAIYDLALFKWARELPKNDKGQVMVPLYGDLKRHVMTDADNDKFGNELLSQRFVERSVFATTELWGIGSTAPYGHRGDMTILTEVILAHGGEAKNSRDNYDALSEEERENIIAYLRTLVIEQ